AIGMELFNDTNGEHIPVFTKIEPLLGEIRSASAPQFAANLEKLIDATPNGRERVARTREFMKGIRAQFEARRANTARQS
ncbi:MAG: hypothetical protein WB992_20765, partial [Bryobacteraceae bacterium]